jgi:hypothetical protein
MTGSVPMRDEVWSVIIEFYRDCRHRHLVNNFRPLSSMEHVLALSILFSFDAGRRVSEALLMRLRRCVPNER